MFLKRKVTTFPAYLGYTVYQSEYDALKAECDRAHKLNEELEEEVKRERKSAQYWYEKYMEVTKKELGIE